MIQLPEITRETFVTNPEQWQSDHYDFHLIFNPETRECEISASPQHMRNSMPMDVWHGLLRSYHIPGNVNGETVAELLTDKLSPLLEEVANGWQSHWNGSNLVGRLTGEAQETEMQIERTLEEIDDFLDVALASDWCWEGLRHDLTGDETDERCAEIADEYARGAYADGIILIGDVEDVVREARDDAKERREV